MTFDEPNIEVPVMIILFCPIVRFWNKNGAAELAIVCRYINVYGAVQSFWEEHNACYPRCVVAMVTIVYAVWVIEYVFAKVIVRLFLCIWYV